MIAAKGSVTMATIAGAAESLQAAVLQSLNWYQYDNATFLAERFHAEGRQGMSLFPRITPSHLAVDKCLCERTQPPSCHTYCT